MVLDVGRKPEHLRLRISPSSPFLLELTTVGEDVFDEAPEFRFRLPDALIVWQADVSDDRKLAAWSITPDDVDSVIARSTDRRVRLYLGDLVWAEGKFEVDRD